MKVNGGHQGQKGQEGQNCKNCNILGLLVSIIPLSFYVIIFKIFPQEIGF